LALSCLNHWLLECGPGRPAAQLAEIHAKVHPFVIHTWQDLRLPKLKVRR
jgi:hypothetical protein